MRRRLLDPSAGLRHNGSRLVDYPEREWFPAVFPASKGVPFDADNLATVNAHDFLGDATFLRARRAAEQRWPGGSRDISWRLHTFLWAASTALAVHPGGSLVELGTGRGFMAAGLCEALDWGGPGASKGRTLHLIDTFHPRLPHEPPGTADRFYYADGADEVREHFSVYPGVEVHAGLLPDALADVGSSEICFIHVDLNHAEAEIASLDALSPRLRPGAFILFDDSGNPGCTDQLAAHDRWASDHGTTLLRLPTGQGLCLVV